MKSSKKEMPFLDHLEELRGRLLWSFLAVALGSVVGIIAVMHFGVMNLLTEPLYSVVDDLARDRPELVGALGSGRLVFLNLTEPFFFMMKLGLTAGLLLASPFLAYHAWAFLVPALEDREKRWIVPSLVLGLLLFAAGVGLAYFVALPMTIRFLLLFGAEWFTPALTAGFYLALVFRLLLAFGLMFELPVVVALLSATGLVSPRSLRAKRRHALVGIAVLASFLSPGDMVHIMLLMMIPMIALYELGILLSVAIYRNRASSPTPDLTPPSGSISVMIALIAMSWLRKEPTQVPIEA